MRHQLFSNQLHVPTNRSTPLTICFIQSIKKGIQSMLLISLAVAMSRGLLTVTPTDITCWPFNCCCCCREQKTRSSCPEESDAKAVCAPYSYLRLGDHRPMELFPHSSLGLAGQLAVPILIEAPRVCCVYTRHSCEHIPRSSSSS